jgi:uncharacterized protein involved in tellurium resistance
MAKPRIFVSSTYYDLKHIRKSIESFIDGMGYESVLFENGDIPFEHSESLDESCYKELDSCQILVLVVGGRYGSGSSDEKVKLLDDDLERHYQHFNSITKKEYETARERDIPIYIFIEKGVAAEFQTYKENKSNTTIKYAHVDSVNVFRLIESIYSQKRNNLTKEFENVEDITSWLKEQWAGLFSQFLERKSNDKPIESLEKHLASLSVVTKTLKDYSENIIRGLSPNESEQIISTIGLKEKHRTDINDFLNIWCFDHLVEMHDFDSELMFKTYIESKSFNEFITSIRKLRPEKDHCMLASDDLKDDLLIQLITFRDKLNLEPWKGSEYKKSAHRKWDYK